MSYLSSRLHAVPSFCRIVVRYYYYYYYRAIIEKTSGPIVLKLWNLIVDGPERCEFVSDFTSNCIFHILEEFTY